MTYSAHLLFRIDTRSGRIDGLGIYSSDQLSTVGHECYLAIAGISPIKAPSYAQAKSDLQQCAQHLAPSFGGAIADALLDLARTGNPTPVHWTES